MTVPALSFEFFPPRSATQQRRFWRTLGCLETLGPAYVSVTWGALGSDSRASLEVIEPLANDTAIPIAAHLSCVGQTREALRATLDTLEGLGVARILALRGDRPGGAEVPAGSFAHASELVALLAAERPHLDVSVAAYPEGHPESPDIDSDIRWLGHKLDAGAARAITQFFFEPETFLRWRDRVRAAGIDKPLVPGILPVHDLEKVRVFAAKCGATVPDSLARRFDGASDEASRRELAIEQSVELCRRLAAEGVEAFHLYTLNQSMLAYAVACELMGRAPMRVAA